MVSQSSQSFDPRTTLSQSPIIPNNPKSPLSATPIAVYPASVIRRPESQIIPTPGQLIHLVNQGHVIAVNQDPQNTAMPYQVQVLGLDGQVRTFFFNQNEHYYPLDWKAQLTVAMDQHQVPWGVIHRPSAGMKASQNKWLMGLLTSAAILFPISLLVSIYANFQEIFIKRKIFGDKIKTIQQPPSKPTKLSDIGGLSEELTLIRQRLLNYLDQAKRAKTQADKIKILKQLPKGVLLAGPPGTGKTMIARAIAEEAGAKFIHISASELENMYVGVGAAKLRKYIEEAQKACLDFQGNIKNHAIIFIDEFDTIGLKRNMRRGDKGSETLNQLLTLMDGFKNHPYITFMAATNRPQDLDEALLRPGRFGDLSLYVHAPYQAKLRQEIIDIKIKNDPDTYAKLDPALKQDYDNFSLELAKLLYGGTGADIDAVVKEAEALANDRWLQNPFSQNKLTLDDFKQAIYHVLHGRPITSILYPEHFKETTTVHELGHALVRLGMEENENKKASDIILQIRLVPTVKDGEINSYGHVVYNYTDEDELTSEFRSRKKFEKDFSSALGARAAEINFLSLEELENGAGGDLGQIRKLFIGAIQGGVFADKFGLANIPKQEDWWMLSEQQKARLDSVMKEVLDKVNEGVNTFMKGINPETFHAIKQKIIDRQTIDNPEEINELLEPIRKELQVLWQKTGAPALRRI